MMGKALREQLQTLHGMLTDGYAQAHLAAIIAEHTPPPPDPDRELEVLTKLMQCAAAGAALEKMSDEQIGKLLIEHAWPHFDMLSPLSDLVNEAAERLKGEVKCQRCDGTGTMGAGSLVHAPAKCSECKGVGTVKGERK